MEDFIGEIVTAVVMAVAAAGWRKIESGWLKGMLQAAIVGVEKGTRDMAPEEAAKVKEAVKVEAERTGAQGRLHKLVKAITQEKKAA